MRSADTLTTADCRKQLLGCLLDVAMQQEVRGVLDLPDLPTRFLPPGKRADLYHLYVASRAAVKARVASVQTFYRAFSSSGWSRKLRFRRRTQHTQCSICHKLRAAISHSHNFTEHARNCDKYHRHLAGMFADRKLYETMKARASCLTIWLALLFFFFMVIQVSLFRNQT